MTDDRTEPGGFERFWNAMEWFQFLCAALAILVLGGVLFVRPEPIPEFPYRHLAAVGCWLFGGLMLFAFAFGKTAAGRRVKCLLVACPMALLALGGWAGIGVPAIDAWRIAHDGIATEAVVLDSGRVLRGESMRTVVTIQYDGHRGRLQRGGRRGDVIPVLYSASHPSTVAEGRAGASFLALLLHRTGGWLPALGFTVLFLVMSGCTLAYLWAGLFGSTDGMVE